MFIGIGIGINRNRFGSAGEAAFASTQWQLITTNWESITTTWN
jgi:hypothetical protein